MVDATKVVAGDAQSHHIVQCRRGRWFCQWCRMEAWNETNLSRLRGTECNGHVARLCHSTHRLQVHNGVLWCKWCGAYTTRQPRALARACPRRPISEAAANVRARLERGLPPTSAAYLDNSNITAMAREDGVAQFSAGIDDGGLHGGRQLQQLRSETHVSAAASGGYAAEA